MQGERPADFVKKLVERGGDTPCPRCHHEKWATPDEYLMLIKEHEAVFEDTILKGFDATPAIVEVCTNCG